MKLNVYSLFDNKALTYHAPFFTQTDGSAVRMLQELVADLNNNVGRHPSDYVLYFIGTYDDSNGQMWPEQPLRHVMDAIALVTIKPSGDLFARSMGTTPRTSEEMAHDLGSATQADKKSVG